MVSEIRRFASARRAEQHAPRKFTLSGAEEPGG